MATLRIETRPDGALVLTHTTGAHLAWTILPTAFGIVLLWAVASGGITVLGAVVILPLALIAVLTGLAFARHRDWLVFDRRAREIVCRRGLGGVFGRLESQPFDAVEAIVFEDPSEGADAATVGLRETTGHLWPITRDDRAFVQRVVTALREVGGWRVVPKREDERW